MAVCVNIIMSVNWSMQVMEILLQKCDSSCVNRKNNAGMAALHIAASAGRVKLVRLLLKAGAKVCVHVAYE